MTRKKHLARIALKTAADTLSAEIWEGKWDHVAEVKTKPLPQWLEVLDELEHRCPGHSREAYIDALARAHYAR